MDELTKSIAKFDNFLDKVMVDEAIISRNNLEKLVNIMRELKKYKDAEEQGLLMKLPCHIGSDIYFIPSESNYKLNVLHKHAENNKVYHQKVARITFNQYGWYIECDKNIEQGVEQIFVEKSYKVTWFTDEAEAEQALQRVKEGAE